MGELSDIVNGRNLNTESSISTRSGKHNRVRNMLASTLVDSLECKTQTEVEILAGRIDVVMQADGKKFAFEIKTGTKADNINKSREQCINYYRHGYYPVLVLTVNLLSELNQEEISIIKDTVLSVGAEILVYDKYFSSIPIFRQVDNIIPLLEMPSCYNCGDSLVNLGDYYACIWCEEYTPSVPIVSRDVIDLLRWVQSYGDMAPLDSDFDSIRGPNENSARRGMDGIDSARDRLYGDDN